MRRKVHTRQIFFDWSYFIMKADIILILTSIVLVAGFSGIFITWNFPIYFTILIVLVAENPAAVIRTKYVPGAISSELNSSIYMPEL